MTQQIKLQAGDALLIVDVQYDFMPGGSLAVPDGNDVIPVLNRYIDLFEENGLPVYASRDWHPSNHCSFEAQGGQGPPHCIQESHGAEFPAALRLPPQTQVISKGTSVERDDDSAFQNTELDMQMHQAGINRLFIGGLATDYCVLQTVKDALAAEFEVMLLNDAVRAVNVQRGDGDRAIEEMRRLGVHVIELSEIG